MIYIQWLWQEHQAIHCLFAFFVSGSTTGSCQPAQQLRAKVLLIKRFFIKSKPCPFDLGLRKFALDPVVVIFFKKCQKNYKCQSDPVVVNFFEMHLIQHLWFFWIRAPLISHTCNFFWNVGSSAFQKNLQWLDQTDM